MNKGVAFITGAGVGAGLAYVFDSNRGSRRRSIAVDKAFHLFKKTGDAVEVTARDLKNRTIGVAAEFKSRFTHDTPTDEVLAERVRSRLGFLVSHPRAIEMAAHNGRVTLTGPVLAHEVKNLLSGVSAIRGVTGVENQLESHQQADGVPGLQGGAGRPGPRFNIMQEVWSPTTQLIMGLAGAALAFSGVKIKGVFGITLGVMGLGMLARGFTNLPVKRIVGIGAGHRAVDIKKAINIAAPVEQVFDLWSNYENFPKFMSNVKAVRDLGEGRSRWRVAGPAGVSVEWDAVMTEKIPHKVLAWKSLPGSAVDHAGIIHFNSNRDGTTQVNIRMSYNPPVGAIGHIVAALFGSDPKSEMDQDLAQMKSFIETGVPPRNAAAQRG